MMQYTVILEKGRNSYGAYVPDIPGCFAVGKTKDQTIDLIKDSIKQHISIMLDDGSFPPEPNFFSEMIEV